MRWKLTTVKITLENDSRQCHWRWTYCFSAKSTQLDFPWHWNRWPCLHLSLNLRTSWHEECVAINTWVTQSGRGGWSCEGTERLKSSPRTAKSPPRTLHAQWFSTTGPQQDQQRLVKGQTDGPTARISDGMGLRSAWEFAFLTMLPLVLWTRSLRKPLL